MSLASSSVLRGEISAVNVNGPAATAASTTWPGPSCAGFQNLIDFLLVSATGGAGGNDPGTSLERLASGLEDNSADPQGRKKLLFRGNAQRLHWGLGLKV
eukprot:Skav209163  [mRNA]  locus=scaffold1137:293358:299162:- [translate_table: standard]